MSTSVGSKPLNWTAIFEFSKSNNFIKEFHTFLNKMGLGDIHPEYGRPAIVKRKGVFANVTLADLTADLDADPKKEVLMPGGNLPSVDVIQYGTPSPTLHKDELAITYKVSAVKKDVDVWMEVGEIEEVNRGDCEKAKKLGIFRIARFLGATKTEDEGWDAILTGVRHLAYGGHDKYRPLPSVEDNATLCKTKTLTPLGYASECGITPDKMHMVEKWLQEWYAKATKTWDVTILRGPAIRDAYYMTLGGSSCMVGAKCVLTEFYCENPHSVGLVVAAPDFKAVKEVSRDVCRALIWTTNTGDIVLDRVYKGGSVAAPDADAKVLLAVQALYPKKKVFTLYTGPHGIPKEKDDMIIVKIPESGLMPYLDTYLYVWSPQDDIPFLTSIGRKESEMMSISKTYPNCSRIAYLFTSQASMVNYLTKLIGKIPPTLGIKSARQQGNGPYVILNESNPPPHGGVKRTFEELVKSGSEYVYDHIKKPECVVLAKTPDPKPKVESLELKPAGVSSLYRVGFPDSLDLGVQEWVAYVPNFRMEEGEF